MGPKGILSSELFFVSFRDRLIDRRLDCRGRLGIHTQKLVGCKQYKNWTSSVMPILDFLIGLGRTVFRAFLMISWIWLFHFRLLETYMYIQGTYNIYIYKIYTGCIKKCTVLKCLLTENSSNILATSCSYE
jgi:hypothetical protein